MLGRLNQIAFLSSHMLRRVQQCPKVKTSCVLMVRNFHASGRQCSEVPNFMGFLSNTESEKAQEITKEVSKKQVLADDDDEDEMEEMFIMVRQRKTWCHLPHQTCGCKCFNPSLSSVHLKS